MPAERLCGAQLVGRQSSWCSGQARRRSCQLDAVAVRGRSSLPRETIETLAEFAGQPARLATSSEPCTVTMHPTHTVGGNNNRFRTGPVQVREDTAWRSDMHRLDWVAVSTLCAPLMTHFGYRLTRRTLAEPASLSLRSASALACGRTGDTAGSIPARSSALARPRHDPVLP